MAHTMHIHMSYRIQYNIYIYTQFVCIDAKGMKAGLRWRIGFHRVCQRLMGFCWTACSLKSLIGIFAGRPKCWPSLESTMLPQRALETTTSLQPQVPASLQPQVPGKKAKTQKSSCRWRADLYVKPLPQATLMTWFLWRMASWNTPFVTFVVGEVALLNSGSGSGRLTSLEPHGSSQFYCPKKSEKTTWFCRSIWSGDFLQ